MNLKVLLCVLFSCVCPVFFVLCFVCCSVCVMKYLTCTLSRSVNAHHVSALGLDELLQKKVLRFSIICSLPLPQVSYARKAGGAEPGDVLLVALMETGYVYHRCTYTPGNYSTAPVSLFVNFD